MITPTPAMTALLQSKAHRFASLWAITRKDATVQRYTSHSQALTFEGNSYAPMSISEHSARRAEQGIKERNLDFVGYLSTNDIESADLKAGQYNGAEVTEYLVDWKYPWQGSFLTNTYFITEITWTGEQWEAQLDGLTTKLRQAKGIVVSRRCRFVLGDSNCGVTVATHTVTGTVTAVDTQRKQIQSDLTSQADGYFNDGLITWTSGDNNGEVVEVATFVQTNGVIVFALPLEYDVAVSDTFDIYPGCGKITDHCKGTSGTAGKPWATNIENFGGFPTVPGTTKTLLTPNA